MTGCDMSGWRPVPVVRCSGLGVGGAGAYAPRWLNSGWVWVQATKGWVYETDSPGRFLLLRATDPYLNPHTATLCEELLQKRPHLPEGVLLTPQGELLWDTTHNVPWEETIPVLNHMWENLDGDRAFQLQQEKFGPAFLLGLLHPDEAEWREAAKAWRKGVKYLAPWVGVMPLLPEAEWKKLIGRAGWEVFKYKLLMSREEVRVESPVGPRSGV